MTNGQLDDSNKRKLSSSLAFFSVGEEEVVMATGAEIDSKDLFFLDALFLHQIDIHPRKIYLPFPVS
jgi:hypothetical protein